jgi:hypothetical protein
MPNGTVKNVTNESDPDLFFALRGGGNNYVCELLTLIFIPWWLTLLL